MILCTDIGNTNTTCAIFEGRKILARFRLQSDLGVTPDELCARLATILSLNEIKLKDFKHLLLASVVPPLTSVWEEMALKYMGIKPLVPRPENLGIPIKLRAPGEV